MLISQISLNDFKLLFVYLCHANCVFMYALNVLLYCSLPFVCLFVYLFTAYLKNILHFVFIRVHNLSNTVRIHLYVCINNIL